MAKRYYQGKKDRMDESKGMSKVSHGRDQFNDEMRHDKDGTSEYRPGKRMGAEYYGNYESRRRTEMEDGGMLYENHAEVANLPQNVIMKPWPRAEYGTPEGLDDTINGIDNQMRGDYMQEKKHAFPKKV